ncbi:MAG: STAS domain-containing protein [Ignavibacteria bacterium]|nr:STAS domain-containing protein [Ignavibacteria bacterium]MBT8383042.1 STAS domain-containing protein [Ignavibacteria bacterium]MBT8390341.1 STAS domain-containing protein [Ignavibacteria bacterium]NNL20849.1 STAS domain-containing protein [Ignavibacteriaceae bacterium]
MKVSTKLKDKFAILKFEANQITGYEAQEFQESLLNVLKKNFNVIVVDLSDVTFISSWGIGMLIHGLTTTKNRGSEFRVACQSKTILQVFKKVKIDTVLNIYSNLGEAMVDS